MSNNNQKISPRVLTVKKVPKLIEDLEFTWSTWIPLSADSWISSHGSFRLFTNPSVQFTVSLKRIKEPASLHIRVQKATNENAFAEVYMTLDSDSHGFVKMDSWKNEDCLFTDVKIPEPQEEKKDPNKHDVTILVKWYGFSNEKKESPSSCTIQAERLLLNENFSDAVLKIGDNKLPVHKIVLALQSPVFESVFTAPMKESIENCVTIEDVELVVMKELLKYLYTGELVGCNDFTIVSKIFQAADKYQIDKLKHLCEMKLANSLAADNVLQILKLSDCHNGTLLFLKSLKFILSKRKILFSSGAWLNDFKRFCLSHASLSFEITVAMSRVN